MASNPVANPEHLIVQSATRTPIPTEPTAGTAYLFSNARDNTFNNSTIVTITGVAGSSLQAVYNRVAPNAILNAGGRADEVKCHPGTRKEVIGRIERWREDAPDGKTDSRMFWLSGPAGAGKSAIVQTVAEDWKRRGMHSANFFFFRSDTSRNHARSLVATLLYQIFDFYPEVRKAVEEILVSKPRILDASLKEQFDQLICTPFLSIGQPFRQSVVLLIDGLDECDSEAKTPQQQVLQALETLVCRNDLPFLALVASRVEHPIHVSFRKLSSGFDSIFLDQYYSPQKDICLFVTDEFNKIKRTHPLAPQDEHWPSPSDVSGIVAKSSGQFIYAATIMRFISDSPAAPKLSLEKVQGAAHIGIKSPFSRLDALYTYILGQADDQEALKDILHAELFISSVREKAIPLTKCLKILNNRYTDTTITSCVAYVAAVARFEYDRLIFYHASLVDYLKDQERSGAYYFDGHAFDLKVVPLLFAHKCNSAASIFSLARIENTDIGHHERPFDTLHDLCVRHNVAAEYRLFLYKWLTDFRGKITLADIPYIKRYTTMVKVDRSTGDVWEDREVVVDNLRPESPSDEHEIALWLQHLCLHMYEKYYAKDLGTYKCLLKRWMFWAVLNNIPFSNLHKVPAVKRLCDRNIELQKLPYGRRYITMARIKHINGDLMQDPDIVLDPLTGESQFDVDEIRGWVNSLLSHIYDEYYPDRLGTYKRLVKQWTLWAVSNNIILFTPKQPRLDFINSSSSLHSISLTLDQLIERYVEYEWIDEYKGPYCFLYLTMHRVDRVCGDIWEIQDLADSVQIIRRDSDLLDDEELLPWILTLLRSIYEKFYTDRFTYKQLIKRWIEWAAGSENISPSPVSEDIPLSALQRSSNDVLASLTLEDIPYARMFSTMSQINTLHGDISQNSNIVVDVLRPESPSDIKEVAQWVQELLWDIHKKFYSGHLETYKRLTKQWIKWAVSNNISLLPSQAHALFLSVFGLEDGPYYLRYTTMAQIDTHSGDIHQNSDIVVDVLRPESASDIEEVAQWVQGLLQSIKAKFYPEHLETYRRLTKHWITWAVSNIPLSAALQSSDKLPRFKLEDLPYGQMYFTMAQIDALSGNIWQNFDIMADTLHPESTSDAEEVALWIRNLLRSIMAKFYPDDLETYKLLVGQWILWAVSNNIPLVGLDDAPDAQRQIFMDTMKKWAATPSKFQPDKGVITY